MPGIGINQTITEHFAVLQCPVFQLCVSLACS